MIRKSHFSENWPWWPFFIMSQFWCHFWLHFLTCHWKSDFSFIRRVQPHFPCSLLPPHHCFVFAPLLIILLLLLGQMAKSKEPKNKPTQPKGGQKQAPAARTKTARAPSLPPVDTDQEGSKIEPTNCWLTVKWDHDRTNCLLDWLDQNPNDCNWLFSDSTVTVRKEGHHKVTAKGSKTHYHESIAKAVFDSPDEEASLHVWYLKDPSKFATSVCNYLGQ